MIIIKSFGEIYESIKSKFYNKTKLDIEKGSVIDMFVSSVAGELEDAHQTIEDNKKPYLFTTPIVLIKNNIYNIVQEQ